MERLARETRGEGSGRTTRCSEREPRPNTGSKRRQNKIAVAIYWSGNRTSIPVAIGPALVTCEGVNLVALRVTVSAVSSTIYGTTVWLMIESSVDLSLLLFEEQWWRLASHSQTAFTAVWLRDTGWKLGNDIIETPYYRLRLFVGHLDPFEALPPPHTISSKVMMWLGTGDHCARASQIMILARQRRQP